VDAVEAASGCGVDEARPSLSVVIEVQALADVATIGILRQRSVHRSAVLAEQLQTALDTRIFIERANGVLAQFGQIDMDIAFQALRRYARVRNLKLSAVAAAVVRYEVDRDAVLAARADLA